MDKFRYEVRLIVEVDAFDDSDAWEAVQDNFGVGEDSDVRVVDCEYERIK
jgi:hypothetical protein